MNSTAIALVAFVAYMGGGGWIYLTMAREQARQDQITQHVKHYHKVHLKTLDENQEVLSSDVLKKIWRFILYKILNFGVAERIVTNNRKILIIAFIFLALGLWIGSLFFGNAGLLWIFLWAFLVRQYYGRIYNRYVHKVRDQLPETVALLVRALRVGTPLKRAIQMVALEMSEPTKSLFQEVLDETAMGTDLPESFATMSRRLGLAGYSFLSVVVALQATAGGGLADVMAGVEKTVRERLEVQKKGVAATGEAKMTSYILLGLPIVIVVIVFLEDHTYFSPFFTSKSGHYCLIAGVTLWSIGFYVIRWLIGRITK
ncbi:MAG: type II secretion system F family protein [Acetobacter sp.]|nr:type II secretion system F family protein [Acetobacter sp.]